MKCGESVHAVSFFSSTKQCTPIKERSHVLTISSLSVENKIQIGNLWQQSQTCKAKIGRWLGFFLFVCFFPLTSRNETFWNTDHVFVIVS